MRRDCTPILIDENSKFSRLERARFGDKDFSEAFLQATLHACPELLPIDELGSDFGPVISR